MTGDVNKDLQSLDNSVSDLGSHIDILRKSLESAYTEVEAIHTQLIIQNVIIAIMAITLIVAVIKSSKKKG
ncbi:hypothetical protein N781_16940 [Pontibacillus halophilus JSM 076056 = DSM 19796]|uniref:Uncharacterized protein n=1 Tax=Pontibacillus halophilus JSM 076056 = DSM 19796 TaxID=1385510 RepID=A0A0A5GH13_9BACI|nr:hypothetical protein [Pontibacillus halophilus]KGX92511.1 hypothetical protein N781_16940 [Pontibacillus halophilus JSM 076056 = DSM 19796]